MTVAASQKMALPRWLARSAWCEMVRVRPEVSSNAVLMVGSQKGPTVLNSGTTPAGPKLGQAPLKLGHSRLWWSRLLSQGVVTSRAYQSEPKKAAKNMTSEKMNHAMLQR